MTPSEFKSRFIELLPPTPPDFDLALDQFVTFRPNRVAALRISENDRAILIESGLPVDAAPFLSFGLGSNRELMPLEGFPESVMIGHNGSGDMICLDQDSGGAVVYYNHDNRMERIFMNASLSQFAQCLCAYAKYMRTKDALAFRKEVVAIDADAMSQGSFWPNEVEDDCIT